MKPWPHPLDQTPSSRLEQIGAMLAAVGTAIWIGALLVQLRELI